jgi:hypothetical protein
VLLQGEEEKVEIKLFARTREIESAQEATLYAEKETRDM